MFENIKKRIFPSLITLTALSISFIAAYVSVIGLGKLFAGAEVIVMIIASILEFSKIIVASILYSYRKTLSWIFKIYLVLALIVLMTITSIGIYGFLSGAYEVTSSKSEIVNKELSVYKLKNNRFIDSRNILIQEKQTLDNNISSLREGLANNKTQYKDRETGQIITTTSSSNRKSLEQQLNQTLQYRDTISVKIEALTDSITRIEMVVFEKESNSELSQELGPLKYISRITGKEIDEIVNWIMILLIVVFDPLAICLVVVSNFSFEKLNEPKPEEETQPEIIPDNIAPEPIVEETPTPPITNNIILPDNLSTYRKNQILRDSETKTYF